MDLMPSFINNRWCVLNYPNPGMAQEAGMPTTAFENYFYRVCTMDYAKMRAAMEPLKELMDKTDRVKIVGKNTDLNFSIKNQIAELCSGECNIPDGEIMTAPVRESVNGKIHFDIPTKYDGFVHNRNR